jgi:FtsP/CotA-like multicopper oxidase with cupredoxin domain
VAIVAALAIVLPIGWMWKSSLLPHSYSVMDMGRADFGGGPQGHDHGGMHATSVTSLVADSNRAADVDVTLIARQERFQLASGRVVDGFTLNGTSPGPVIRATAGQLVQVRLINESVREGVTLHWHGVDVPNAEDGVAGVTQDAVTIGEEFTYRFVADQVGTFWYHSHQVSHKQVRKGLLGALVVTPADAKPDTTDVVALVHLYNGVRTVNGHEGTLQAEAPPGQKARVRVINSDNGPMSVWTSGAPFQVVAFDGMDVHGPTPVTDEAVLITAGGRADLEVAMPSDGSPVRVELGGSAAVALGSSSYDAPMTPRPKATLDMLTYGTPAPIPFDAEAPDRRFTYSIGRRPGFLDGKPGMWWTINGRLFPDVPMYVVAEGDVVQMHIANHSGAVHPMHLHGHHAVVLSRNGVRSTGSPWWIDSLNVNSGESYDIAFIADNPGIWMDHCHNLPHATQGLVAHLMYEGVMTPFVVGGKPANRPE